MDSSKPNEPTPEPEPVPGASLPPPDPTPLPPIVPPEVPPRVVPASAVPPLASTPPIPPAPPIHPAMAPLPADSDARMWIVVLHLSGFAWFLIPFFGNILAPVILWNLKKSEIPGYDAIGKHVINFQITYSISLIVAALLIFACIGVPFSAGLVIVWLIFMIVAAIRASNGEPYKYPCTIAFLK